MENYQVVAAILTAALCSIKPRTTSHRLAADEAKCMARLQQVPEGTGKNGRVHRQARNQSRLSLDWTSGPVG